MDAPKTGCSSSVRVGTAACAIVLVDVCWVRYGT